MKPFIKWVGGKTQLLDSISPLVPSRIRTYYEPFLGGGAVFFSLDKERYNQAVVNDLNTTLTITYETVRDRLDELLDNLRGFKASYQENPKDFYYETRAKAVSEMTDLELASWFLFLNKTAFNGLYRVNRKGDFNVPWGKYRNPNIVNEETLRACSEALQGVRVESEDFEDVLKDAGEGDFVYFDPPYVPLNATSDFTSYTKEGFKYEDQKRLASLCHRLREKGVRFLLSNSDTPVVRDLYAGFEIRQVMAKRNINSKGNKRGAVAEALVVG